jgi:hypothetical protein
VEDYGLHYTRQKKVLQGTITECRLYIFFPNDCDKKKKTKVMRKINSDESAGKNEE